MQKASGQLLTDKGKEGTIMMMSERKKAQILDVLYERIVWHGLNADIGGFRQCIEAVKSGSKGKSLFMIYNPEKKELQVKNYSGLNDADIIIGEIEGEKSGLDAFLWVGAEISRASERLREAEREDEMQNSHIKRAAKNRHICLLSLGL